VRTALIPILEYRGEARFLVSRALAAALALEAHRRTGGTDGSSGHAGRTG